MKRFLAVLAIALLAASCTGGGPNPAPSGTPLSNTAIRLRILDALNGNISFCGPPVVMTPRTVELRQELKSLRRDQSLYRAILEHEHLLGANPTRRDLFNVVRVF